MFRDTIDGSSKIQIKLISRSHPAAKYGIIRINSFIYRLLLEGLAEGSIRVCRGRRIEGGEPVWKDLHDILNFSNSSKKCPHFAILCEYWKYRATLPKLGSWCNMLATDPPCAFEVIRLDPLYRVSMSERWIPTTMGEIAQVIGKLHLEALGRGCIGSSLMDSINSQDEKPIVDRKQGRRSRLAKWYRRVANRRNRTVLVTEVEGRRIWRSKGRHRSGGSVQISRDDLLLT